MPSKVRFLVVFLVALGVGTLTWGIGGLLGWNTPLIRDEMTVYMDSQGAIGIGIGALAGAATAVLLFRDRATPFDAKKPPKEPYDLS